MRAKINKNIHIKSFFNSFLNQLFICLRIIYNNTINISIQSSQIPFKTLLLNTPRNISLIEPTVDIKIRHLLLSDLEHISIIFTTSYTNRFYMFFVLFSSFLQTEVS